MKVRTMTFQASAGALLRRAAYGILTAALLCTISGCIMPMSVTRAFGKGVLIDPMGTTYGWSPALGSSMRRVAEENLGNHVAILDSISSEMSEKGYSHCESGTPDFWAAYDVDARDTVNPWTNKPITELTFTVSIRQVSTDQIYYKGTAFIDVDGTASPEVRMNTLREAVRRILDHFPVREKEKDKK